VIAQNSAINNMLGRNKN